MRAIIVDDEPIMLNSFMRLSRNIEDLQIVGKFGSGQEAIDFAASTPVELAFLDIAMPIMNGIETAKKLREIRPDILIVFISAYDEYIRESNQIGGDYYIVKPYRRETLEMVMERLRLMARRQEKSVYIQTFGVFTVLKTGKPIALTGRGKEILAYVVTYRGKEVSNQTIYGTLWENRPYGHAEMTVFYNALRRLRETLEKEGLGELLISTQRGQMVNVQLFDCDYYAWLDKNTKKKDRFEGEFLTEYSWAEEKLAALLNEWE